MPNSKTTQRTLTVEPGGLRWPLHLVEALFDLPFNDLMFQAQSVHRASFNPNEIQLSSLLSIKTGACPEDCKYCPQSARYKTGLDAERLMRVDNIVAAAQRARDNGASRFCMGAAWRSPKDQDLTVVEEAVRQVKELGLETCATLGMLTAEQASSLQRAGLDYYNHNLDTSEEYYKEIITTRTYQDRLDTLEHVRDAGMNVCSGGIIGMGETRRDRAALIANLANLPVPPQSVPINNLIRVSGTPLDDAEPVDDFEFIRTIAVARITMPASYVRLSAGREAMNDQMQAMCFLAGANSVFYGEELLTTSNASVDHDRALMQKLGLQAQGLRAEDSAEHGLVEASGSHAESH
ncbi:biotin synthase BioB [Arenicella xantha]|uniref:Biotin synthase n=1 Tax=Arenicella xantha TaxID=644221 RepID=A0A395JN59_9GAMM|nr:biotin synthase [Arenicella xantha]